MAKLIGTSGAWKAVCGLLEFGNLYPEDVADIHKLLSEAERELDITRQRAVEEAEQRIETLKNEKLQLEANLLRDLEQYRAELTFDLEVVFK